AFTRFHETATALPLEASSDEAPATSDENKPEASETVPTEGAAPDAPVEPAKEVALSLQEQDPELYSDVPSLITGTQIREAMDQIAAELRAEDQGLLLIEGNAGYRLVTHPRFARWVRILRQEPPPVKLSQSSIETLAV